MIGTTLAHYRITEQLGKGGMGEVYRATDTKLNRDVALKILPESFAQDPHRLGRFEREAQVLASLNHPNIAAVHGVEDQGGQHALVMELVEGEDLSQRISRGPIPLEDALAIALQIAEGLEDAHEKGIIHRDLKPANVRITPEGKVKILDFGLAKALEGDRSEQDPGLSQSPTLTMAATQAGIILGTAAYMSPEQARGKVVDKRTDIWAFGAVLFEMLAGQKVFQGEDLSLTLASVMRDEPDWERLPDDTPTPIRRLLSHCLVKEPKRRVRDIGDARIAIQNHQEQPEEESPESAATAVIPSPLWSRPLPWASLGLCFFAFLLGLWLPDSTPPEPTRRLSIQLGTEVELDPNGPSALLSADGSLMAFLGVDEGNQRRIYVRRLNELEAVPLAGTESAWDHAFSPDGRWIAFRDNDQKLKKISVSGGAPLTLCDASNTRGISWGEAETIVFGRNGTRPLFRISSAGGTPEPLTTVDGEASTHRWPQVLPGAAAVVYTAHSASGDFDSANIVIERLSDGKKKVIVRGGYHGRYLPSGHVVYLHQGTLFAVPFDLKTWETQGQASPTLAGVQGNPANASAHLSFSQDGSLLYVAGGATRDEYILEWLTREGERQPLLSKPADYGGFRFSPDGQRLAVEIHDGTQSDIWTYDWQRDTLTRLTFHPADDEDPVWSPGGGTIVFSSERSGNADLYWKRSDGSGKVHLLAESPHRLRPTSWHPSGDYLAIMVFPTDQPPDIHVLSLDGEDRSGWKVADIEPFLSTPFAEGQLSFSPGGHWVVYLSIESRNPEVYVRPFPGPGGKWQISSGGGLWPQWAAAENELFYQRSGQLFITPYQTEADSFVAEQSQRWVEGGTLAHRIGTPDYALHPDGQRLAVRQAAGDDDMDLRHPILFQNFFDHLKESVDR